MSFPERLFGCIGWALAACFLFGCTVSPEPAPGVASLEVVRLLPVESPFPVEPSGLCLRDGRLFAVSDKTDDTVFEVVIEDTVARFVPYLRFTPPAFRGRLDFEGIAVAPDGGFFLASETAARVVRVEADGTATWATPSALEAGREAGLFRAASGQVEGLAVLPDGGFLLAAERQPRGLITLHPDGAIETQVMNETRFPSQLPLLRITDLTGLDYFEDTVWALFRNGDLITTLERHEDGWREGPKAWSFRAHVRDPSVAYTDMRFGHAEGLAVDANYFYVILDNNQVPREQDRSDRRPLLLVLARPSAER